MREELSFTETSIESGKNPPDGLRIKYMTVYPHVYPFLRIHRGKCAKALKLEEEVL